MGAASRRFFSDSRRLGPRTGSLMPVGVVGEVAASLGGGESGQVRSFCARVRLGSLLLRRGFADSSTASLAPIMNADCGRDNGLEDGCLRSLSPIGETEGMRRVMLGDGEGASLPSEMAEELRWIAASARS